jgi:hypothetical protein
VSGELGYDAIVRGLTLGTDDGRDGGNRGVNNQSDLFNVSRNAVDRRDSDVPRG